MPRLRCENSRRLTGANLFSKLPGAVLDLIFENDGDSSTAAGNSLSDIALTWHEQARQLLEALGWAEHQTFQRNYDKGVSLGLNAPIDCLYSAADLNEAALLLSAKQLGLDEIEGIELEIAADPDAVLAHLRHEIENEKNPALLAMAAAAEHHQVLFLFDDDFVSLGSGSSCQTWPVDKLPVLEELDWKSYQAIPIALVTGTNGKSTSVRLACAIAEAAALTVGTTSTDYIKVGDSVIDRGDYSGPGGARTLLRDSRVDIAFLELARGGLLRRGLGVPEANAALITNVAADHLGDYGINTVEELREAKFIVQKALATSNPLVLNADDEGVVNYVKGFDQCITWFAESLDNPVLANHVAEGGEAFSIDAGEVVHIKAGKQYSIVAIEDIPVTLKGQARHNVQNVLGVCGICSALGIDYAAMKTGLSRFKGDAKENPGRGNFYQAKGVNILIDFAHNEHGMRALATTAANIESKRRLILMGQAGDRSDEAIIDMVNAAMLARPDCLVASETPGYERGREAHETADVIANAAVAHGLAETNIMRSRDPAEGIKKALDWAEPGDFLLFFVLTNRDQAIQIVEDYGGTASTI